MTVARRLHAAARAASRAAAALVRPPRHRACTCGLPARPSWQAERPPYEGWSIECPVHGCFDPAHTYPGRKCPSCHAHFVRDGHVPERSR